MNPLRAMPLNYYLNLFSPETYEAFMHSTKEVSGFSRAQLPAAQRIQVGDRLICYLTKLSRWVGIFDVRSTYFVDSTPIFYHEEDPFVVRFKVNTLVWLPLENAIPIKDERLWKKLSFTKDHDPHTSTWTGRLRGSLTRMADEDAHFLEDLLLKQKNEAEHFPLSDKDFQRLTTHTLRRPDSIVEVSVPGKDDSDEPSALGEKPETRESLKVQATLAQVGLRMGMQVWIPRSDRGAVLAEANIESDALLTALPLNYEPTTLRTIEQIDVLWLRGRSIARAFEVEHTTAIYSGILRMADLVALQPNLRIKLHIVAPESRREKVFQELTRPVFSVLEAGPLSELCTYLSYDSVRSLSAEKYLEHLSDSVLDEYEEQAEIA
jgi:hypothetical protein